MRNSRFFHQVDLLLDVLPFVATQDCFALKGGTAINLFHRNMPRLSVDIDLTYLPLEDRSMTLLAIDKALKAIAARIEGSQLGIVPQLEKSKEGLGKMLVCSNERAKIKVEVNQIVHGSVYPCEMLEICQNAQDMFQKSAEINTETLADLFGGKICAALDRQHPRDLFDIKLLLENEGITDAIRKSFIVYLASHNRPMSELIHPNQLDVKALYESDFKEMTAEPVTYEALVNARRELIEILSDQITNEERLFLISIKEGNPRWDYLGIEGIENMPAIRWKLQNINKMAPDKREASLQELKRKLAM